MASDTYWKRRQAEADSAMERDERALAKRTARAYETEMAALDREIASYYQRWGTDGVLSYRTMLETMDASDRDLLMRDCDAFAKAYPDLAGMVAIRKEIYKLDRLEGLQASARCHLAQATAEATDGLSDHFARQAARSANAVADTMGFGRSFYSMDDDAVRRFVGTKWSSGQDYSQLIWGSTDKLAGYVADDMAKAFARGDSYDRIGRALHHRFVDVAESNVARLVYTEGTYVARQAQAAEFRREGFDTYKLSTVGDERTCSECSGVASASESEPFRFVDESVGVNFPPLHPRCRCQVNPAVTDWDAWCKDQMDQERARKAAERFGAGSGVGAKRDDTARRQSSNVIVSGKQFGRKLKKHAGDWGLDPGNSLDRDKFYTIVAGIIDGADDVITGEWRSQPGTCTFYRRGNDVVVVNENDEFVTVMRGGSNNARYRRAVERYRDTS